MCGEFKEGLRKCVVLKEIQCRNSVKSYATALQMDSDNKGSELPRKNPQHWMDLSSRWVGLGHSPSTVFVNLL